MAEQKRFVLYEYLVFFWKKKVFFLIIPLIFTLLGFGGSYLVPKEGKYVGSATVFTGSIKLKGLTNPININKEFGEHVHGVLDSYVSSESYIKIKIYDDNKERLEQDLQKMTSGVERALVDNYDRRYKATEDAIALNVNKNEALEGVLESSSTKLESNNLTIDETSNITSLLEYTEFEMATTTASIAKMTADLEFFEPPSIVSQDVKTVDTYKLEFSLAGLILGVFATFLILMLWNYINEARRYYKHD
ncbi:hypothetical protein RRV45_19925 [Bacillus sp. DTU_2020_1000418_1_SI_GHA_SEK_038]|uniref:hypothetical protein n=1 Tax=Bacillus sp. DTU_2020_1000418_1_SI_GHA_SEK_038 TaxID=3077585 RepID=UPI0028F0E82A|nr:hypothetical protein [Bacillus sp. DTU_2020_1000418_1_SI_GHA_SEK_038]WNS75120.1 hypothetical protein RRV45_19925 [Bacillus sp. DTU_2020_1000418_1_SI_GHA_SEK_038]